MGYENGQLPKKVVKLVNRLADLQRKQVEVMRLGMSGEKTPDELYPLKNEQFETGSSPVSRTSETVVNQRSQLLYVPKWPNRGPTGFKGSSGTAPFSRNFPSAWSP